LKNRLSPFESLRANGEKFGIVDIFPFMLSLSKYSEGFSNDLLIIGTLFRH